MKSIIIYVTYPNARTAKAAATYLLNKKMIACAVFLPAHSLFIWKGKVRDTKEVVALFKTKATLWKTVKSDIDKLHPYDVPCILKIETDAFPPYEEWMDDVISFRKNS